MINKYGPMIQSVVLILQAYKASLYVCEDIEVGCEGRIQDLTRGFMTLYNEEFYSEGDRVDSYLERLFDILKIAKQPVLRKRCTDCLLNYFASKQNVLVSIKAILDEKQKYEESPDTYLRDNK